ncbi:mobilization protein [Streptomyces sp. NRRL F-5126]|uniref:mobilization protein n=1 Tax=Streptomyces sp. NRRL F-5126 TaxID=1463857 RepID=UPI0004C4968B|nr:mobilization protein [Streptomyces sp. NRRL F-5126]
MIAKISGGKDTAGLIRYLYGPGRANEHTDPHLVASFDGFAPDPGRANTPVSTRRLLVADLNLRVNQARRLGRTPKQQVWHCSIRAAGEDRHLSDTEWADIARRIVAATGIAPEDDADGCRWVAVRHADDHIHIAATTVRGDLRPARHWNDYLTADSELAAIEKEYSLRRVIRGDRTAAKRPTRAEVEQSHRANQPATARERLRCAVRTAVAASTSAEEFLGLLGDADGVLVEAQCFPSGDVRGYKVALEGDTNAAGQPIWFSGSKLAPDLSFPKIRARLTNVTPLSLGQQKHLRRAPWHRAADAAERIPHHLDQTDDRAAQAHLAAFGEALDALPLLAPQALRPQLRRAATAFERATRSRIRAEDHHALALRRAVRTMLRDPASAGDGAALAMFLDIAVLVAIAATRWHQLHCHDQQVAATRQTLRHLETCYAQAAAAPLTDLASRCPDQRTVNRQIRRIRRVVPEHADRVVEDDAFNALAATLAQAEATGHDTERALQQAIEQRPLDDVRYPAQVLIWRLQRLNAGADTSSPARAAQAHGSAPGTPVLGRNARYPSKAATPATTHKATTRPDGPRR